MESPKIQNPIKVSVSFADSDIIIAERIILGLIEKGVKVYSDNNKLINNADSWGVHKLNLIDKMFEEAQYCIVLLTKNFMRDKWTQYRKCKLIEEAIVKSNFILPVKIGDNIPDIPGVTKFIGHLQIQPDEFQLVIDTFVKKAGVIESETIKIKRYSSIEKTLKNYNPISKLEKKCEYLDKSEKVGFEFYKITHPADDTSVQHFLYLYEGMYLENTHRLIKDTFPEILEVDKSIILIPKEKKQVHPHKRKANIKELFDRDAVHYIDEFIASCTPDEFLNNKIEFPIRNFVDPKISENKITALNYLKNWYKHENDPILVLKGSGGIGKTTVAKMFANYLSANLHNTRILFISLYDISAILKQHYDESGRLELYDIYKVYCAKDVETEDYAVINHELFKLNLDNGNIVVIIDGFDEMLSTFFEGSFDIKTFFASIEEYTNEMGNGKVLFTCRNHFWNRNSPEFNFKDIELLPFSYELAERFFRNNFPSSSNLVNKGLRIASSLLGENPNREYIPFVLDMVNYIIDSTVETSKIEDPLFNSEILNINIRNDYILYKICYREIEKLGQTLDVDSQIKFFIHFANEYNSSIKKGKLDEVFKQSFSEKYPSKVIEAMKAHPVLHEEEEGVLSFRYDFFEEYFKNIYLGQLFKKDNREVINPKLIEILIAYVKFNSDFTKNCCFRLGSIDDEKKLTLISILEEINEIKDVEQDYTREMAISAIFVIALRALKLKGSFSNNDTTELLKDFFYKDHMVKNCAIHGLNLIHSEKIIFNFCGLTFSNCYFKEFDYFWECEFDENTYFDKCLIKSINIREKITTTAQEKNFDLNTCNTDYSFEQALKRKEIKLESLKEKVIQDLKSFLKSFYQFGKMRAMNEKEIKRKYRNDFQVFKFEIIIGYLVEYGFVERNIRKYGVVIPDWKIADKYEEEAIKYCFQGSMSIKIKDLIEQLVKKGS